MVFWEIIAGLLGGIIGGMGMGGGTLTIPILTIFLSYKQLQAQGVNLVAFLPMSVIAIIIHIKNKLIDFKSTWLLAVVGCVFSLFASLVAVKLKNEVLTKLFAIFLICLAIWQLVEFIKLKNQNKDKKEE